MDKDLLIWLFFRMSGRVGRAAYFLAGMLLNVIEGFVFYRFTLAPEQSTESTVLAAIFWAVAFVSTWCSIALGVKRLHDFAQPGIMAVALLVPFVNVVAFVVLCLYPGDPGPNRFGAVTNAPR